MKPSEIIKQRAIAIAKKNYAGDSPFKIFVSPGDGDYWQALMEYLDGKEKE